MVKENRIGWGEYQARQMLGTSGAGTLERSSSRAFAPTAEPGRPGQVRRGHEPLTGMLARGLGWFSIALGAMEVLNPDGLARWLGMEDKAGLIRVYGVREIGTGIAILMQDNPRGYARWIGARVAGDALDLATLAPGLAKGNTGAVITAIVAVAGVTVLDIFCAAASHEG
jgi:hypothetical protein